MIAGTIVFEDTSLHWQLLEGNVVRYTVQEGLTGHSEVVECTWEEFGAAMALAIASDEIVAASQLYAVAEAAMPKLAVLRWIP